QTKRGWVEDCIRACLYMADIYQWQKDKEKQVTSLLQTFTFETPRPEACCKLGDYFTENNKFNSAIFWYKQALITHHQPQGFHFEAFSTWYLNLSLCAAYWKTNNKEKALKHHEIVKEMRPNDPIVLYNQKFFDK